MNNEEINEIMNNFKFRSLSFQSTLKNLLNKYLEKFNTFDKIDSKDNWIIILKGNEKSLIDAYRMRRVLNALSGVIKGNIHFSIPRAREVIDYRVNRVKTLLKQYDITTTAKLTNESLQFIKVCYEKLRKEDEEFNKMIEEKSKKIEILEEL